MKTALVLGAGGFIGSHMVKRLKKEGYYVRGVDLKAPEFDKTWADDFVIGDLRDKEFTESACRLENIEGVFQFYSMFAPPYAKAVQFDEVYQFAADMGGAGYIFTGEHDADIMHNSAQISLNVCKTLTEEKPLWLKEGKFTGKVFYSSSACIYPQGIQSDVYNPGLKEDDAYPADPDSEYGWEKIFSERLYLSFQRNFGLDVRIARFHNIYGPEGTFRGGKEKAPAAMCRKAIEGDKELKIWGDGHQTRSFLFIDDCIDAVRLLMESDHRNPVNIGSEEMVTINRLAEIAIELSGKELKISHEDGPTGVRGRNSDNTNLRKVLNGWEPKFSLIKGMKETFEWIKSQHDAS